MTKTIEELQAQRIKELEEDRNDLCARIEKLENKLEVAEDRVERSKTLKRWLESSQNSRSALYARIEKLENKLEVAEDRVERSKTLKRWLEYSRNAQNGII